MMMKTEQNPMQSYFELVRRRAEGEVMEPTEESSVGYAAGRSKVQFETDVMAYNRATPAREQWKALAAEFKAVSEAPETISAVGRVAKVQAALEGIRKERASQHEPNSRDSSRSTELATLSEEIIEATKVLETVTATVEVLVAKQAAIRARAQALRATTPLSLGEPEWIWPDGAAVCIPSPHSEFSLPHPPGMARLELARDLLSQGVSEQQACEIFGFVDRNGNPIYWKIRAESDFPGFATLSKTAKWEDPRWASHREQERRAKAAEDDRLRIAKASAEAEAVKAAKAVPQRCPESPRQLWEQKVSVEQSAAMLLLSIGEVYEMFREFQNEQIEADRVAADQRSQSIRDRVTQRIESASAV